MGRPEYSNPLTPLIDEVKELVNDVKDAVLQIEGQVEEIKNTDIALVASKVSAIRTNTIKYRTTEFSQTLSDGTWYTALEVAGAGKLHRVSLVISSGTGSLGSSQIRIVTDGDAYVTVPASHARNLRTDSNTVKSADLLPNVQFNSSLLIQVMSTVSISTATSIDWGLFE